MARKSTPGLDAASLQRFLDTHQVSGSAASQAKLPLENVIDIRQTLIMPEDLAKILTPELAEKYMWQKTSTIWGFK